MHTFCKGKSPTSTAAELAGLRLLFLWEITEKVAARLKRFKKNQCLCNYGRETRWLFGLGSVRTEPSSTDQQVGHRLLFLLKPGSKVAPQGWIFPQVSPGPGGGVGKLGPLLRRHTLNGKRALVSWAIKLKGFLKNVLILLNLNAK